MQTKPKGNEFFAVLWWRVKLYSKRFYNSAWGKLVLVWIECMLILLVLGLSFYVLELWIRSLL